MAPTISVTEEVYEALKRRSGSWEDTPSKIIAKLLKVNDKPREPMRKTNHFPGGIIEKLILFVLGNTNAGAGSTEEISSEVLRLMKQSDLIIDEDLEKIPSGMTRIENRIRMHLHDLKKEGCLNPSGREGSWVLNHGDGVMDEVRKIIDNNKLFTLYDQGEDKNLNIPCPKVTYRDHRLCFKKEYIEPLGPEDSFRIICGNGIFQMTKNEFYEVFNNVIATRSYKANGLYHSPSPPRKAKQFKIL